MFSGWSTTSPKALIASYLASSLGDVLEDIDASQIQSNLFSGSTLSLHQARLQSGSCGLVLKYSGSIDRIELSWEWGGTTVIRNVVLTVSGVDITLKKSDEQQDSKIDGAPSTEQSGKRTQSEQDQKQQLNSTIQQLVDHLTLKIIDVNVTLELPSGSDPFHLHVDEFELLTQQRESTQLSQHLTGRGMGLKIGERSLLDNFDYSTFVRRVSGRRFMDGINQGLQMKGTASTSNSDGWDLHIGPNQIQALHEAMSLFQDTGTCSFGDGAMNPPVSDPLATTMSMPLPALTVTWKRDEATSSKFRIASGTMMFSYRMDGTMCEISGTSGISMGDGTDALVSLDPGVSWVADLNSKEFRLQREGQGVDKRKGQMASIHWHHDVAKRLLSEVSELSFPEVSAREAFESSKSGGWSFKIPNPIRLEFHESTLSDATLHATVASISYQNDGSLEVGPCHVEGFGCSLNTPALLWEEESERILALGDVNVYAPSYGAIDRIVQLFEDGSASETVAPLLPCAISVATLTARLEEENNLIISVSDIHVSKEFQVALGTIHGKDNNGIQVLSSGIRGSMSGKIMCVSAQEVSKILIPDVLSAESPLTGLKASFHTEASDLSIGVESADVTLLLTLKSKPSTADGVTDNPSISQTKINFNSCHLQVGAMNLRAPCYISGAVFLEGLDMRIQNDSVQVAPLKLKLVDFDPDRWMRVSLNKISMNLRDMTSFAHVSTTIDGLAITVAPSLGQFDVAIPNLYLSEDETLSFGDGAAEISVGSTCALNTVRDFALDVLVALPTEAETKAESVEILPFNVAIPLAKLSVLSLDGLGLGASALAVSKSGLMNIGALEIRNALGVQASLEQLSLSLKEKNCKIGLVSRALVPNLIATQAPVKGIHLSLTDEKVLQATISTTANVVLLPPKAGSKTSNEDKAPMIEFDTPFSLRLRLSMVLVHAPHLTSCQGRIRDVDISVHNGSGGTIQMKTNEVRTALYIVKDAKKWFKATLGSMQANVSLADAAANSLRVESVQVSASPLFGEISISIPGTILSRDSVAVVDTIIANFESESSIMKMRDFAVHILDSGKGRRSDGESDYTHQSILIAVKGIEVMVSERDQACVIGGVKAGTNAVSFEKMEFKDGNGSNLIASKIVASLGSVTKMTVGTFESMFIPHLLEMRSPIFEIKIEHHEDNSLDVNFDRADLTLLRADTDAAPDVPIANFLPMAVRSSFGGLSICLEGTDAKADVKGAKLEASPIDDSMAISLKIDGIAAAKLSQNSRWIELSLNDPSIDIKPTAIGWVSLSAFGRLVKVTSHNGSCASIESISMPNSEEIVVPDVSINASHLDASNDLKLLFQPVKEFFMPKSRITDPSASSLQCKIAKIIATDDSGGISCQVENVVASSSRAVCERFLVNSQGGLSATLSDVKFSFAGAREAQIGWIEAIHIPHAVALKSPVRDVRICFRDGVCRIQMVGEIDTVILPAASLRPESKHSGNELLLSVPFPARIELGKIRIAPSMTSSKCTEISSIDFRVTPLQDPFALPSDQQSGFTFLTAIGRFSNQMLDVSAIQTSGLIVSKLPKVIQKFHFSSGQADLTAGYSDVEWSSMFGGDNGHKATSCPVPMPNSRIEETIVRLTYKGKILSTGSTVRIPAFWGGPETTSNDLLEHTKSAVIARAPSFITGAKFMGESIVDSSAKGLGQLALKANVAGSVIGVAAADLTGGAIRSGKLARNAAESDGYKFGDFTRGSIRSLGQLAKRGGSVRRGDSMGAEEDYRYQAGDLSSGIADASSEYVSSNKSRLSSAGGGGLGATIGLAIAGPVGFVAGSYIGSSLGARAFKESVDSDDAQAHVGGANTRQSIAFDAARSETTVVHQVSTNSTHRFSSLQGADSMQISATNQSTNLLEQRVSSAAFTTSTTTTTTVHHESSTGVFTAGGRPQNTFDDPLRNFSSSVASPPIQKSRENQRQVMHSQTLNTEHQQEYSSHEYQHHARITQVQKEVRHDEFGVRYTPSAQNQQYPQMHQHTQQQYEHSVQPYQQQSRQTQHTPQQYERSVQPYQQQARQTQQQSQYRFGDLTRSVVAAGKQKSGRDKNSNYRFGDFTRGLFG